MTDHIDIRLARLDRIEAAVRKMDEKFIQLKLAESRGTDVRSVASEYVLLAAQVMVAPFELSAIRELRLAEGDFATQILEKTKPILDKHFPIVVD